MTFDLEERFFSHFLLYIEINIEYVQRSKASVALWSCPCLFTFHKIS